ncbi:hypothetical protein N0V82_002788 [Gnomoniopsis sp. IMI 355080]|nr:hypothetical protein N0V82_002788 [Gnomoniopsis sp. IMI 355080]
MRDISLLLSLSLGLIWAGDAVAQSAPLPIVDLGMSIHQATLNATGGYLNFSNIPYAQPPVGDLRFKRSVALTTPNRTLNDGSNERICPQAMPLWQILNPPPPPLVIMLPPGAAGPAAGAMPPAGAPPGASGAPAGAPPLPPPDPRESEDCLLLDVMVPQQTFNAAVGGQGPLAPVMVWIHGGGFALGGKSTVGNPSQLLQKSVQGGLNGMVYVQMNYRLGMFGFPPKGPQDTDVDTNAGLFDQRLALEWVQQNIKAFGGDPTQVTVMGESAGAVSVWSQLTAFGSPNDTTLMKRAIIQSPAQRPKFDAITYGQIFEQFVAASNVTSMSAARTLDTSALQNINRVTVGNAPFATLTYGANVDNDFIPALQTDLLAQGNFAKNVDVIVAHNLNEGLIFTDQRIQNNTGLAGYLSGLMPSASPETIQNIINLYPEDFSGAQPYTTQLERLELVASESLVTCNANALEKAFGATPGGVQSLASGGVNGYLFAVSPGIHALDTSYTFFNGQNTPDIFGNVVNVGVSDQMQNTFLKFAITGQKAAALPALGAPTGSVDAFSLLSLDVNQTHVVQDPSNNPRCQVWQTALG